MARIPLGSRGRWRWTHGSFWHAVVSHMATISIHAIVTSHISRSTHRWRMGVTGWWTHGAFRHAVISIPAVPIHAHVTHNLSAGAGRWLDSPTRHRADVIGRQAGVSHRASISIHPIVTHHI